MRRLLAGVLAVVLSVSTVDSRVLAGNKTEQPPVRLDAADPQLQHIGGRWYQSRTNPQLYYYDDGGEAVELFSYHFSDSNKDGIPNVQVTHDERFLIMHSQGYPNHPTALFPNDKNPNSIRVQDFVFRLPLQPQMSKTVTRLPMGPVGVALNGVVFFNPFEAGGMNAVEGYAEVWLDSCCGHPQQEGVYHYHKYPTCVKSPFRDDGKRHSPIIGFAFDGFPVYGPFESDGVLAKDLKGNRALDECSGHEDPQRGYHYHVTPGQFPYILGGYAGVVEPSNNHLLHQNQRGAIRNNATGSSRLSNAIASVTPNTGKRGQKCQLQIRLAATAVPGRLKPTWVQFGPFEASSVTIDRSMITATVDIPADANTGVPVDLHVEFGDNQEGQRILVLKKNDAFRVTE